MAEETQACRYTDTANMQSKRPSVKGGWRSGVEGEKCGEGNVLMEAAYSFLATQTD